MKQSINREVLEIDVPGIRKFSNRVAQYEDNVNLTIGEPDFPTPTAVKNAGIEAILNNHTGYSHNAGMIELREAVSDFFETKYKFYYDPGNEIIITNGASEALDSVLRTVIAPGDEVILIAPFYSAYESLVILAGGKPVYLDTSDTYFKPDKNRLEGLITDKTKAIIVNYPTNPTGVTLNKPEMDEIVNVLNKHKVYIISDEIYSENSFFHKHISFANYSELRDRLFLVHGLSKSHAMTGWRIGYLLTTEKLATEVLKVHLNNSICAAVPSQYAGIEALTNSRTAPQEMTAVYKERCLYLVEALENMKMQIIQPEGAFYIFPNIRQYGLASYDFATQLIEEEHMAVVPGSGFSEYGEGFIRISFASDLDTLKEGMKRLQRFCSKLN